MLRAGEAIRILTGAPRFRRGQRFAPGRLVERLAGPGSGGRAQSSDLKGELGRKPLVSARRTEEA